MAASAPPGSNAPINLSSPSAIGNVTPATGSFTTLNSTGLNSSAGGYNAATSTAATASTLGVPSPSLMLTGNYWNNASANQTSTLSMLYTPTGTVGGTSVLSITAPSQNVNGIVKNFTRFVFPNEALSAVNSNDSLGMAVGETYYTGFLCLDNTGTSANGSVPASTDECF